MPRVNVYLPDELAEQAKRAGLNISALTQDAIRRSIAVEATNEWLARLPLIESAPVSHQDALDVLDEVREERSTRHD